MVILFQISASIALFFLINLIGRFAPVDSRYYQITSFLETDEAPAFNFSFRILTPVVFIILISTLLYHFKLGNYVKDIYLISIYYVIFRALFNVVTDRTYLINWKKQVIYAVCTVLATYVIYEKLIIKKENLLPNFSDISNELWIIILIFLYNLVNNIQISDNGAERRKLRYIKYTFSNLKERYSNIIDSKTDNNRLKQIIYAIMLHENFNRPKAFRLLEYIKSIFSKHPVSLGIMQVKSDAFITDSQSVEKGIEILRVEVQALLPKFLEENEKEFENSYQTEYLEQAYQAKLIRKYNHCDDYTYDIIELMNYINEKFYRNNNLNKILFGKYITPVG